VESKVGIRLIGRPGARVLGQRGAATTTEPVLHVHDVRLGQRGRQVKGFLRLAQRNHVGSPKVVWKATRYECRL
jgi:hypothetical protein